MAFRDKLVEREGEPISHGPVIDLIKEAARVTGEPPWRIRWDAGWQYSRIRFAVFFIAHEGGLECNHIAQVFEIDHSSVIYGRREALKRAGKDEQHAILIEALRWAWQEIEKKREVVHG